jgi:molybdopterin-guanine dinucleotide biosynthesis protein A
MPSAPLAPRPLGLVLAGGRSRRFGREKALAEVDGRPMIAAVAAVLARGCAAVAVNAPEGSGAAAFAQASGFELVSDLAGDPDGPLAGVRAGLLWARSRGARALVTAPCDLPFLPQDYVERLAQAGGTAVAETPDGGHWLCALWSLELLEPLERRLAGGGHGPVRAFLAECGASRVAFDRPEAFANVNLPGDLSRA